MNFMFPGLPTPRIPHVVTFLGIAVWWLAACNGAQGGVNAEVPAPADTASAPFCPMAEEWDDLYDKNPGALHFRKLLPPEGEAAPGSLKQGLFDIPFHPRLEGSWRYQPMDGPGDSWQLTPVDQLLRRRTLHHDMVGIE